MPRFLRLVSATALLALATTAPALADPPPANTPFPDCDATHLHYCVVSITADGAAVPAGTRVDASYLGAGAVNWTIVDDAPAHLAACPAGMPVDDCPANLDPATTYRFVLDTGEVRPRDVESDGQDAAVAVSGDATGGYRLDVTVRPAPLAYLDACLPEACGDDTTRATFSYDGFVSGLASDLSTWDPATAAARTGYWQVTNAQYAGPPRYDHASGSFSVQLANVHLPTSGSTPIAGAYEAFLPPTMLVSWFGVDPATLGSATVTVTGVGGATTTATLLDGGLVIGVAGFHFSSPRVAVRVRGVPGAPRRLHGRRLAPARVRLAFAAPRLRGGSPIVGYRARCTAGRTVASASGSRSPLVVGGLPRGRRATCTVRARNARGAGLAAAVAIPAS